MHRPAPGEYTPYFEKYIALVPGTDLLAALEAQIVEIEQLAGTVTAERETYCYANGKWSVREVLGHIIDGERVFGYRVFCISRGETAALPLFEDNAYVAQSSYRRRRLAELAEEFIAVRRSNLLLLGTFSGEDWTRQGTVGTYRVSSRALAFIMAGHAQHHLKGLQEHYGVCMA